MEQLNLPSNSLTNQKKLEKTSKREPVVSGKTKKKSKSIVERMVNSFVSVDPEDVKRYLIKGVLEPTLKKTVIDVIKMYFYGNKSGAPDNSTPEIVSYNRMSGGSRTYLLGSSNMTRKSKRSFDDIWFSNYDDVEKVQNDLNAAMATYKQVTVADLFESAKQPSEFTDNRYGWKSLADAQIVEVSDGWVLKMPPAEPLD